MTKKEKLIMISKTLKFKDINGEAREIKAYFHINEAEQAELSVYKKGGLKAYMEQCLDSDNSYGVVTFLKTMIAKAYGRKVRDPEYGTIFMKDEEETKKFINSEAYSVLFMELMSDEKKAIDFINSLTATSTPTTDQVSIIPVD